MAGEEIARIQRMFVTRLDTLAHILDVAERHLPDFAAAVHARLAPDMLPLGTQIAFACNQPRGFAQWCAGQPIENLPSDVASAAMARAHIQDTRERVQAVDADDAIMETSKRIVVGPGMYCELPAREYLGDFLLPNWYFHVTTAYAILRHLGVPLGKADYMHFLVPHVRREPVPAQDAGR